MSSNNKIKYTINLMFILYFIVLITERCISVIQSIINKVDIFASIFNVFVYFSIFLSIGSFLIYYLINDRASLKALFIPSDANIENIDFKSLVTASGILLISGMVHSEYTISVVQFISYGFFVFAIILQGVIMNKETKNNSVLWLSIAYLIAFSMAIPVTYYSKLSYHIVFHIIEGISSYALVIAFVILTKMLFNGRDNLFILELLIVAVILDASLIVMRWQEEINYFVLIFISVSLVLFIIGTIVNLMNKKKMS